MTQPQFSKITTCSPLERRAAAQLIHSSFHEFYELASVSPSLVIEHIEQQYDVPGSELQGTFVALVEGRVAGVHSSLLGSNLAAAQVLSTSRLARTVPMSQKETFFVGVAELSRQLPPVPALSWYLSRFAVSPAYFGTGLAEEVLAHFSATASPDARYLSLHVSRSNTRAIAFYKRVGFSTYGGDQANYMALVREITPRGPA